MALTEDEADFMHAAWQSSQPDGLGAHVEYVAAGCGISIQSASDLADALWHKGLLDNDGSGGAVVFTSKGRGVAIDITAKRKAERKAMAEPTKEQLTRWRDQADSLLAWVNEQSGGSFAVQIDAYKYCNGNNLTKEDIDGILNYFLFSRKHLNGYYVGAMVLGDGQIDEAEQTEQSVSLTEEGAKHLAQIRQAAVRSSLPPAPHVRSDLKTLALIRDLKERLTDQSNSDIPIDEGRFFVAAFDISFERDPKGIYKFNWIKLGASIGFNEEYSRHWIDRLESRGYAKMVEGNDAVLTVSGKEVGRSRAISPTYWSDLELAVVERAWKIWLGDRYAFNPWAIIGKEPQLPLKTEEMRAMRARLIRRGVWKNAEVEGAQPDVATEFTEEVREIYKDRFGTEALTGLGVPSMRPMKLYDRADAVEERLAQRIAELNTEIAELKAKHDPSQAETIERLSKDIAELKQQRDGPVQVPHPSLAKLPDYSHDTLRFIYLCFDQNKAYGWFDARKVAGLEIAHHLLLHVLGDLERSKVLSKGVDWEVKFTEEGYKFGRSVFQRAEFWANDEVRFLQAAFNTWAKAKDFPSEMTARGIGLSQKRGEEIQINMVRKGIWQLAISNEMTFTPEGAKIVADTFGLKLPLHAVEVPSARASSEYRNVSGTLLLTDFHKNLHVAPEKDAVDHVKKAKSNEPSFLSRQFSFKRLFEGFDTWTKFGKNVAWWAAILAFLAAAYFGIKYSLPLPK